jgi:hypothetical protein
MDVEFRRTGERRYSVIVHHRGSPPVEMGGPGYDPLMPHDLLHLLVEQELGLRHGIFGFLAAVGSGTRMRRAKLRRRENGLLRRGGRDDGPRSERATYVCLYEWLRRSVDPERRKRAAAMTLDAEHVRNGLPDDERAALSEPVLARVCARMDDLSARWARLRVGDSFTLAWPGEVTPARTSAPAGSGSAARS